MREFSNPGNDKSNSIHMITFYSVVVEIQIFLYVLVRQLDGVTKVIIAYCAFTVKEGVIKERLVTTGI